MTGLAPICPACVQHDDGGFRCFGWRDPRCGQHTELQLLPKSEWRIERCDPDHIAAGVHVLRNCLHWAKIALRDLPNEVISADDLKRFGIDVPDMPR